MEVFVARQPILTVEDDVYAYELLYRNSEENRFVPMDENKATSDVLMNSFVTIGLERLSNHKPCFINFTEDLLLEKIPAYFAPEELVVEILEDVSFSFEMIQVCRELKSKGYTIALDDFIDPERASIFELLHYVDIIKVDIRMVTEENRRKIMALAGNYNIRLLAEKVETREEHERCLQEGFELFQGFYYSRPDIVKGVDIPFFTSTYVQMLMELSTADEDIDMERITKILEQDPALTYKLLRLINTSRRESKIPVESIKQAVMLLGTESLKKWLYVLSVDQTIPAKSAHTRLIVKTSLVRAKMCEQMAVKIYTKEKAEGYFLTGFMSLIDVLTQRPSLETIEPLPLAEEIKEAFRGENNTYRKLLDIAVKLEAADFDWLERLTDFPLTLSQLFECYGRAAAWAERLFHEYFNEYKDGDDVEEQESL
ncbi:EAL domain-containing protein [Halobacillus kuroshimensis]|uniref:EAL domain-containing protein n=3 Tax=Halobacillus kuroshimensis TaxID=302481 RepID=A0ABS3DXR8_9BACI|nr:EAL domain-containing protein [Halobacillus kuroshimensis]MBN8236150.1 EAL domain-containing protein [Halobacillus kuroshimensis]